jgi:hypothetical protein
MEIEMNKIMTFCGLFVTLALMLTACGGDASDSATPTTAEVRLDEEYADALPVPSQLAIGTLLLEDTDGAVTAEQAAQLLPNYQMLQALQSSGTAAQAELDAVLKQIQEAMTSEQLTIIKEMQLTADNMLELMQERGLGRGFAGGDSGTGGAGRFQPPAGAAPGGGGPDGGFGGGFRGGFGGGGSNSSEEQQAAIGDRLNQFAGTAMTGMLVSLLQARAAGETWQVAAPNQDFILQRALFEAITTSTGIDQQELMTQTREGNTLLEIAEANGADADKVVAQVVAAETERVNQAVADGSMEKADADAWLADLEARIREMLDQSLQFRGPGARAGDSTQP